MANQRNRSSNFVDIFKSLFNTKKWTLKHITSSYAFKDIWFNIIIWQNKSERLTSVWTVLGSLEFRIGKTSGSEFTRRRVFGSWISTEAVMGMGRSLSLMFSWKGCRDTGKHGINATGKLQNNASFCTEKWVSSINFKIYTCHHNTQTLSLLEKTVLTARWPHLQPERLLHARLLLLPAQRDLFSILGLSTLVPKLNSWWEPGFSSLLFSLQCAHNG